ncbi:NAD(P)H dehydrogenase (quinone) [Devosia sp. UYZn731]|uniref:NAD(P)H-binding protein n=1 Tax=Devosia sp. UYZn731 TaxID=3156345 RepID=UPI003393CACD
MLVVTGASGQLGRKIIENLLRLVPAERIGASCRNPEKLADIASLGVRVRGGDFEDAESLRHAWDGADRLLLVSSNAAATGGDTLKQHATAIEVAQRLKVGRVFYTSQVSSSSSSLFPPARHHAATEMMLAESGLPWTALRHGFYAASGMAMNARGIKARTIVAPLDGKVAWTTHDDLAAADAALLTSNDVVDGPTAPLTGSEALDLADIAQMAGQILGTSIPRTVMSDEDMRKNAEASGVPQAGIGVMMGYYYAARAGEFRQVDSTLANMLGREPETMSAFMTKTLG